MQWERQHVTYPDGDVSADDRPAADPETARLGDFLGEAAGLSNAGEPEEFIEAE
jgi:hypothetical protein